MTPAEMLERLRDDFPDCLTADGFDEALIGVVDGACRQTVACYDFDECVRILMERDGISDEEAIEYLMFNTLGAYVGEYTPLFLCDWRKQPGPVPPLLQQGIQVLQLSPRAHNCLWHADILTLGALTNKTASELLRVKNLGKSSFAEIERELDRLGLALKREGA